MIIDTEWDKLMKVMNTSEGLGGQSTIEINKDKTLVRKKFNKEDKKYYFIEKNLLTKIDHPSIIKLHDSDDIEHTLYFKYYSKGTAFKHYIDNNLIKIHDLTIIKSIFLDLLNALTYLYENNITHRDIKLENILIDELGNHVLCDFGLSRDSLTKMKRICGTYNYMAPEMWYIGKQEHYDKYNYKIDIFSFGALIIEIVNGDSLFYDEYRCRFKRVYKELDKYLNNTSDDSEYSERKIFSEIWYSSDEWIEFKNIIIKMIEPNPDKRYDYENINNLFNRLN
jgi:serine/threonine protein kinase